jgi:hypothetical protein
MEVSLLSMANKLEIHVGLIYTQRIGIRCISLYERRVAVGYVKVKDTIAVHIKKKRLEYLPNVWSNNITKRMQTPLLFLITMGFASFLKFNSDLLEYRVVNY